MLFSLLLGLAFQHDQLGHRAEKDIPLPALGFIMDGKAFVLRNKFNVGQRLQVKELKGKTAVKEFTTTGGGWETWPRLSIEGGSFWFGGGPLPGNSLRVPFADLDLYHLQDLRDRPVWLEKWKKRYPKSGFNGTQGFNAITHNWGHDLVFNAINAFPRPKAASQKLYCADIVPIGKRDVKMFLLFENKKMKVYRQQGIWDAEEQRWFLGGTGHIETINFPFREYFYAFVQVNPGGQQEDRSFDDAYFFLTESGRLFLAQNPTLGEARKIKLLWGDKNKPIVAVIIDVDRKKTYLFGKDNKAKTQSSPTEFFFELTDGDPDVHYYSLADIQPVLDADGWLRTVLERAQVLPGIKKDPANKGGQK